VSQAIQLKARLIDIKPWIPGVILAAVFCACHSAFIYLFSSATLLCNIFTYGIYWAGLFDAFIQTAVTLIFNRAFWPPAAAN